MRCVKFVVILLIMYVGCTLSCCVNPRRYACSAGEACASNPKHCTTCHKKPANVRVKRAAYNQVETETIRDYRKADHYHTKTTLHADNFEKRVYKTIDNDISNDISREESQTSETLIFLNASYMATEVATTFEPQTLKDTQETLPVEESTVHETNSLTQEQTSVTEPIVSPQPDLKKEVPKVTYQRGVLDLLIPAERLLTFKSYFEALKRFLSATF